MVCPVCGGTKVGYLVAQKRWQCSLRHPRRQFTVKVGTVLEDSALGLGQWLITIWLVANSPDHVTAKQVRECTGVTQRTAWSLLRRVRAVFHATRAMRVD